MQIPQPIVTRGPECTCFCTVRLAAPNGHVQQNSNKVIGSALHLPHWSVGIVWALDWPQNPQTLISYISWMIWMCGLHDLPKSLASPMLILFQGVGWCSQCWMIDTLDTYYPNGNYHLIHLDPCSDKMAGTCRYAHKKKSVRYPQIPRILNLHCGLYHTFHVLTSFKYFKYLKWKHWKPCSAPHHKKHQPWYCSWVVLDQQVIKKPRKWIIP